MKRVLFGVFGVLLLTFVAAFLYVRSVWNPSLPERLVTRVHAIAAAHGGFVSLKQIPRFLQQAVIATEDRGFYHNAGISFEGIGRALLVDLEKLRPVQGASTITEQLVKDIFLTDQKTIPRKLKQITLALFISRALPKNEILDLYLNEVYLGHGAYGVADAARVYFNRPVSQLSQAECALLAGLPQAPSAYDPLHNLPLARIRQREVLQSMAQVGYITPQAAKKIAEQPLHLR